LSAPSPALERAEECRTQDEHDLNGGFSVQRRCGKLGKPVRQMKAAPKQGFEAARLNSKML
jgi:hypothetical protein